MWVAGHNCYVLENWEYRYLDFSENLAKEAEEEIWITLDMYDDESSFNYKCKLNLVNPIWYIFEEFLYKNEINNEWVWIWLIITYSEYTEFTDWEVVDFKWFTPEELRLFINNNPDSVCSVLELALDKSERFMKNIAF